MASFACASARSAGVALRLTARTSSPAGPSSGLSRTAPQARPYHHESRLHGLTARQRHGPTLSLASARPSLKAVPRCSSIATPSFITQSRGLSLWPSSSSTSQDSAFAPSDASQHAGQPMKELAEESSALPDVAVAQGHGVNEGVTAGASDLVNDNADKIVNLSDISLSTWSNVRWAQEFVNFFVETTGLPWWANIALVTISVRLIFLPIVLRGQSNSIRLASIQPEINRLMRRIKDFSERLEDSERKEDAIKEVRALMAYHKVNPIRSLLAPLTQGPVFISFFFALRRLSEEGLTSMKTGGLGWFTDLTLADPYVILPILSSLSMLAVVEAGSAMGQGTPATTKQANNMKQFLRLLAIASVPFIYKFPAAVFCYWLTNNMFSIMQLVLLQQPSVRRVLKLPPPPRKEDRDPYEGSRRPEPLSFWQSMIAGKESQMPSPRSIRNVGRNGQPSALQRGAEGAEGLRRSAFNRIVKENSRPAENGNATGPRAQSASKAGKKKQ